MACEAGAGSRARWRVPRGAMAAPHDHNKKKKTCDGAQCARPDRKDEQQNAAIARALDAPATSNVLYSFVIRLLESDAGRFFIKHVLQNFSMLKEMR